MNTVDIPQAFNLKKVDTSASEDTGHPFLCADYHKEHIFVVDPSGRITWQYRVAGVHDVWMLTNGNILCSKPDGIIEVTADKKVIWQYRPPKGYISFGCQPIGAGNVLTSIIGPDVHLIELAPDLMAKKNILVGRVDAIRLCRKTIDQTYLLTCRSEREVREYDDSGKLIRTIHGSDGAYLAVRSRDNLTFISSCDGHYVYAVNAKDKIVWKLEDGDIPELDLADPAGIQLLPNGNLIICNWGGHGRLGKQAQIVEVTPDKQLVWQINNWDIFGTPLHVQLLDQPVDGTSIVTMR